MVIAWISEIAKALGYAVVTSILFVLFRAALPYVNTHKAAGSVVLRATGYPLMLVGFFTVVLGALLSRLDMVYDGGRWHVTVLR